MSTKYVNEEAIFQWDFSVRLASTSPDNTDKSFLPHSTLIRIDPDAVCIILSYFEGLPTSPRIQSLSTRRQTMRAAACCPLASGKVISGFNVLRFSRDDSETRSGKMVGAPESQRGRASRLPC